MRLDTLYRDIQRPSLSFEFFPPKTEAGEQRFWEAYRELATLSPDFVSITYGAGGSTRERTERIVVAIAREGAITPVAHLTCVGASEESIAQLLARYEAAGVENILALRGDLPEQEPDALPGPFRYASDLIRFIRARDHFAIACATYPEGHPESPNGAKDDARYLKLKQDLGACVAITQYFFNNDDYFRFVELAGSFGVTIPIVPGIMPIRDFDQIARFSAQCGASIPRWLAERFAPVRGDAEATEKLGVEIAIRQCEALLAGGAPGLHFYTLNRARMSKQIVQALGLDAQHRA